MSDIAQHTPTPWFNNGCQVEAKTRLNTIICTTGGNGVQYAAKTIEEAKSNAAFIVKAVNCHEIMLRALKECAANWGNPQDAGARRMLVDAALAAAEDK